MWGVHGNVATWEAEVREERERQREVEMKGETDEQRKGGRDKEREGGGKGGGSSLSCLQ